MNHGGARKGAGRKPVPDDSPHKRIAVGLKLPRYMWDKLRGMDRPAAALVEDAIKWRYRMKPGRGDIPPDADLVSITVRLPRHSVLWLDANAAGQKMTRAKFLARILRMLERQQKGEI